MTAWRPWLPTSAAAALTLRSPTSVALNVQADKLPDSKPSAKIRSGTVLVAVGVRVNVGVDEGPTVGVSVGVDEGSSVGVSLGMGVSLGVGVSLGMGVSVGVSVGTSVLVGVNVFVGSRVFVGVNVLVGVNVSVGVGVFVDVLVGAGVLEGVAVGMTPEPIKLKPSTSLLVCPHVLPSK